MKKLSKKICFDLNGEPCDHVSEPIDQNNHASLLALNVVP